MAYKITVPFYAFRIYFQSGVPFYVPLNDQASTQIGQPLHQITGKYAELLQRKILDKGQLEKIMEEYVSGDFLMGSIEVKFPAAKNKVSYPKFSLAFNYFYNTSENGCWGIIPVLGLEAFSESMEELEKYLVESVQLDFARKRRLTDVRSILTTIWQESVELLHHEMELQAHYPKELEKAEQQNKEKLLPLIGNQLNFHKQIVYGQASSIEQMARALKGKFLKNVLLVGPSGVGKTALVWEMSRQLKKHQIAGSIWETTASVMIKELMRDTGWQDNLSFLCKELTGSQNILFIRNLMELFEVGQYEGNSVSVADYLRSFLARGEVTMITECTEEELAKIEIRSSNYLTLFQVIRLREPTNELEHIILNKVKDTASSQHISISEDAIKETIRLNRRFTPYSGMPGKPIRFLESIIINKKNDKQKVTDSGFHITRSEVIRHFGEETGMPIFMIDPTIPMNTTQIKTSFNTNVFGQEDAVDSLVDILASVKTALTRTGKPIASFLFVGPTGVGKTELAKVLAEFMFGSRDRMIRFDMSEYSNPYSVMRLLGSAYHQDGLLTSAIRREPFCVLLFDEIEKAHSSFNDLLLQILSEGRLTDQQGRLVNFCSTIIIMTSNIGARNLQTSGLSITPRDDHQDILEHFMNAVQKHFRPELYNRMDRVIPFHPLDALSVRFVVEREIELFKNREGVRFRRMQLEIKDEVLDYLADQGYNPKYGARQLQRAIRQELLIPLATQLNSQDPDDQLSVDISVDIEGINIQIEADALGLDLLLEELDKITQADYASILRRRIMRIREGSFYIQLLSELERFENLKKKQKSKFWSNRSQGEKYTYYLETKSNVENLIAEIEQIEENLSLSCLGLQSYKTELSDQLKTWEDDFFELKIEIYTRLNPKSNTSYVGIYGAVNEEILAFYLQLFERKGYDFIMETIWYRENLYKEELMNDKGEKQKSCTFFKQIVNSDDIRKPFKAKEKNDMFCGVEFVITGNGSFLFLKNEQGGQKWKKGDEKPKSIEVKIENSAYQTPIDIHRPSRYSNISYRRTIENQTIKDNPLGLNREFKKDQLVDIVLMNLDQHFKTTLDGELF